MLTGGRGSRQRVGGPKETLRLLPLTEADPICTFPTQSNSETRENWPGLPWHGEEKVQLCPDPRQGAKGQCFRHAGPLRGLDSALKAVGSHGKLERESDKNRSIIRKPSSQLALALCRHQSKFPGGSSINTHHEVGTVTIPSHKGASQALERF